jgi:flagellin
MASFGDFNRVNTNVTALSAQLSLNKINSELGDSRLKLSTGKRINSAEDDSAGYAIATKLNSRVKGLEQALQNVSDAKSMLDVVEGAYNSIMDNLIEIKNLSIQAASDTLGQDERTLISHQIHSLGEDINDIANSTKFNSIDLLPIIDSTIIFQSGDDNNDTFSVTLAAVDILNLFGGNPKHLDIDSDGAGPDLAGGIDLAVNGNHVENGGDTDNDDRGEIEFGYHNDIVFAVGGDFNSMISHVDQAISVLNSHINELGINQRSLSSKEENLTRAITANSAAHSRIMDTDFAKEQSNSVKLQILQQTATAALSQANMGPQAVLGFINQ